MSSLILTYETIGGDEKYSTNGSEQFGKILD